MKILAFDQVFSFMPHIACNMFLIQILQFDLKSKFDMLQKTILRQLSSFQTYSHAKSICQLQDKHFLSVKDCCALVRPFMSRKLNEFSETLQVGM